MITGNKGEWSELYVLLNLLASGKLYSAGKNMEKLENVYFPILKILRDEKIGKPIEYDLGNEDTVELYINDILIKTLRRKKIKDYSSSLLEEITRPTNQKSFTVENSENILNDLCCTKLKAPSTDKTDIQLKLHDIHTGYEGIFGFSIKSELGQPPTLFNSSQSTNFIYKLDHLTDIESINNLKSIKKRISLIARQCTPAFIKIQSNTFSNNLLLIDSYMEKLLGEAVLYYYKNEVTKCLDIVNWLENDNPLNIPMSGFYTYKFKKLLCAIALGMVSSTPWNGYDEANGGYIIVRTDGEVLSYHIYNRNAFEDYLLSNTKFETASSSRNKFGNIYEDSGDYYIKLNLQIRFIK